MLEMAVNTSFLSANSILAVHNGRAGLRATACAGFSAHAISLRVMFCTYRDKPYQPVADAGMHVFRELKNE
jgi:hypothetical protein